VHCREGKMHINGNIYSCTKRVAQKKVQIVFSPLRHVSETMHMLYHTYSLRARYVALEPPDRDQVSHPYKTKVMLSLYS